MWVLPVVAFITLLGLALRNTRWAKVSLRASRWTYALIPLSLIYFPMKVGFRLRPVRCEWTFDFALAIYSLRNIPHIVMFAIFFVLTWAQLPNTRRAMAWSFVACLVMGFLVEIAEGATGIHHCRMRDLVPDMAGASIGAVLVVVSRQVLALRTNSRSRA